MKKLNLVFVGVIAVSLFSACEPEELEENNQEQSIKVDKEKITGIDKSKVRRPGSQWDD